VTRVTLRIGLLSGVEAPLLESAFTIAKTDTVADGAELITESVPPSVVCERCGLESDSAPNDLRCGHCGSGQTRLVRGDELILAQVELGVDDAVPE